MEKLQFNPNNKKYYSDEFIKGFECGVERQFNVDIADNTMEQTIEELENIKAEIQGLIDFEESCCDNTILGYECLDIIDKHIVELKGGDEK